MSNQATYEPLTSSTQWKLATLRAMLINARTESEKATAHWKSFPVKWAYDPKADEAFEQMNKCAKECLFIEGRIVAILLKNSVFANNEGDNETKNTTHENNKAKSKRNRD